MSNTPETPGTKKLSIKFLVTNSFAGSLIGSGGNAIKELMEVSGARVTVSSSTEVFPGTSERVVLVIGNESSISSASALIWELLAIQTKAQEQSTRSSTWSPRSSLSSIGINDDAEVTMRLTIPDTAGGLVLGRGGLTIRSIGETSGARIQMTSKDDAIFTHERILTISGNLLSCRKCTDLVVAKLSEDIEHAQYVNRGTTYSPSIRDMLATGLPIIRRPRSSRSPHNPIPTSDPSASIPVNTTIQLMVPDNLVGNILGKQGSTMREIMSLSGAKVSISPRGDYPDGTTNRTVTISGSPISAQTAHIYCTQKLQQGSSPRSPKKRADP